MMKKSAFKLLKSYCIVVFLLGTLVGCSSETDLMPDSPALAKYILNEAYGTDSKQVLDVFLPAGRSIESTPIIIYIHGGAWVSGSKNEFDEFRASIMESFPGFAFASIGYRLFDLSTGKNQFPAQQVDVKNAVAYVASKTESWQISKDIILAGASAGGHLALLHAFKHQSTGRPKAVVAFFPPTDLAAMYNFNEFTKVGLGGMLGGTPDQNPDGYAINSPITYIRPTSPITIFFHGTIDSVVPLSQSELLATALAENGVNHKFVTIPNQGHGFTSQTYSQSFKDAAAFIAKNMK